MPEPSHSGHATAARLDVEMPKGATTRIDPPFDGDVVGHLTGTLSGDFAGTLTDVRGRPPALLGKLAGTLLHVGSVTGTFCGSLDPKTGRLDGAAEVMLNGAADCGCGREGNCRACTRFEGRLRPWRRIDISQLIDGQPIGGLTIQVQVPGPGVGPLPPTGTRVKP